GKELDEENGMYYFEHRYHAPPTFISRDKYFSKMPFMSPYAYCANNPVGLVDLTGDSINVSELYKKDSKGNYIYPEQIKSFEAFANTKGGKAELAKYAAAGQKVAGITFEKSGAYHTAGVDVEFIGGKGMTHGANGLTGATIKEKRLVLDIAIDAMFESGSGVEAYTHEILVHGRQFVKDYTDNKKLDNSHVYKELGYFAKKNGTNNNTRYMHHWQEKQADKVMEKEGVLILQEFFKKFNIKKTTAEIKEMIRFEP
ncbi:MAG: hypothetical protein LBR36_04880, partial [Bacteroidales bacterium]|nr:hypothetical protein [Bacteroidales bacterium]